MTKPVQGCKARQYSDQMNCPRCGLVWDMNDPDPPPCGLLAAQERNNNAAARALAWCRRILEGKTDADRS